MIFVATAQFAIRDIRIGCVARAAHPHGGGARKLQIGADSLSYSEPLLGSSSGWPAKLPVHSLTSRVMFVAKREQASFIERERV